ncbi:transporter [Lysobacter sp. GX 14042]|uniref:transporter n=1 Tax=Lysobacter sp. GX 14042 TaxID=2907155 RepID=UPI001F4892E7|nr:transporter [Lysobacter sp. GX 14042]MCE7032329.1 transporter [Lysobacter sp. GX 14042]
MDTNASTAVRALAAAALAGLGAGGFAGAAQAQSPVGPQAPPATQAQPAQPAGDEAGELQALTAQLEALKHSYAQEVRRLRELDMQLQALQSRIERGTAAAPDPQSGAPVPAPPQPPPPPMPPSAPGTAAAAAAAEPPPGHAGTAEEAERAQQATMRSVQDVKQQQQALFNRRLTLENSLSYNRYDRKQLTLTGFLALDAIFLGNIAIENVESDTLTWTAAARYGLNPRTSLNIEVPWLARKTVYQKGGAGGAASAIAQEHTTGTGLGDITLSANYRVFTERANWPDTVLTVGVTAPTGQEPYGVSWRVLERDDDGFIRFAVPEEEPTGSGAWQANVGMSFVKTADPAILFANFGYMHPFARRFDDLDNNPDTVNPGEVWLGRSFYFGAGLAFAFNERTSLSLSVSDKLSARARTRYDEGDGNWLKVIGSDANAAMFNLGVTYALSPNATFVTQLGIGLTPDAPDFSLIFKVPYML